MNKIKVFLVYAINSLDTQFLMEMDFLAHDLRQHPRIEFIEYPKPAVLENDLDADTKVYQHIENIIVNTVDLFIAVATCESTGLGVEIGIANQSQQKTLLCFDVKVDKKSRVTTGSRLNNQNLKIIEYSSGDDLFEQISSHLPVKI